ncbi:MaoC/PaaZ C-terminal domain-containing protein [Amycolatopsis sp. NPDC052450]|uniref:MaoC/PaaZ C-terminal domain-containing protein n=1 Tax=Amycolatopsis sp. NPDC052450 TaxID=3363937 RepID=UPI0037C545C8
MTAPSRATGPAEGSSLPVRQFTVTRSDLIRYAAASGDLNPLHWSDRRARQAGLPGVVAHGMLTLGLAIRAVVEWAGPQAIVLDCRAGFTQPVVVPDDDTGACLSVGGTVTETPEPGRFRIRLTVHHGTKKVLGRAHALVVLRQPT